MRLRWKDDHVVPGGFTRVVASLGSFQCTITGGAIYGKMVYAGTFAGTLCSFGKTAEECEQHIIEFADEAGERLASELGVVL